MCRAIVTAVYVHGRSAETKAGSGAISVSGATALNRMIDMRGASVRTTRCGVARSTPLVKRSSTSPTMMANGPAGASSHASPPSLAPRPSAPRTRNCSPGAVCCMSVNASKSVCGAMPTSAAAACGSSLPGYDSRRMVPRSPAAKWREKQSRGSPKASARPSRNASPMTFWRSYRSSQTATKSNPSISGADAADGGRVEWR
mmetsp:Transcript_21836/g.69703  ORF Transcript_21836/g.69703 Transcript_21836/m.69703 type:complete len:201 (+) Transcript_21836:307-909(+)